VFDESSLWLAGDDVIRARLIECEGPMRVRLGLWTDDKRLYLASHHLARFHYGDIKIETNCRNMIIVRTW